MIDLKYIVRKKAAAIKPLRILIAPLYRIIRNRMNEIKRLRCMEAFNRLQQEKRIFLLGIPETTNVGDLAQEDCAYSWFKRNYPSYQVLGFGGGTVMHPKTDFLATLMSCIKSSDYIFFESGGNMNDFTGSPLTMHRMIVENIRNVPIIFLPQTIKFYMEENARHTATIFNGNPNVFLMSRDPVSYDTSCALFPAAYKVCYPDFATTMIGSADYSKTERSGIIVCFRNDREKYHADADLEGVIKALKKIGKVTEMDTCLPVDYSTIKGNETEVVQETIDLFSRARVIITDRYHGTIFSLVAGTPVIVLRSIDHKVVTGQTWLKQCYDEYIEFAATLDEVFEKAQKMYQRDYTHVLGEFPDSKRYDSLGDVIENWKATLTLGSENPPD